MEDDSVDDDSADDDSAVDNVVGTEGIEYTLSEDGTYYSVTGYKGESAEVIIPSVYNDLPVTVIDGNAFFDCRHQLERVVIKMKQKNNKRGTKNGLLQD